MQLIKSATVVILGTNKFSQTAEGVLFHPYHVAFVLPLWGRGVRWLGCPQTPSLVGAEDENFIVDIFS